MERSDFDEAAGRLQGGVGFAGSEGDDQPDRSLMEALLADPTHDYRTLKYGDVMDGTIMHVDRDEILVDIGSKSEGIIPSREFSSLDDDERRDLAVGDHVARLRRAAREPGRACGRLHRPRAPGEELAASAGAVRSRTRSSRPKSPTTTRVACW